VDLATKAKPSILLVDDHPSNLVALEAVLGTSEYHLVTASSGAEALMCLQNHDIALILLDIHMPGMDGFELTKILKASSKTQHIPIILITAVYREDPYVTKAYEAGAVDFFSKPFNPEILRLKVGIYAELYQKNLTLREEEAKRQKTERELRELHTKLLGREKALQLEQERRTAELRTVLESIPDAVYVGDEKGITRCNSKALAMFGCESFDELNQDFKSLADRVQMRYPENGKPIPAEDQPFAHALRGRQHLCQILIRHGATGKDVALACAAAPVFHNGQIIGGVVVNMNAPRSEAPLG
jgi:two-component system, sporulation sensor kinase E